MRNPISIPLHGLQRKQVNQQFQELPSDDTASVLSLHKYLTSRPEKFYSRSAFSLYLDGLAGIELSYSRELKEYLDESSKELDDTFRNVREINKLEWHDAALSSNEYQALTFVDREVNPAYLRLSEAVFCPLLRVIAYFSRVARRAGVQGLNLHNVVAELKGSQYDDIVSSYRDLMRNGTAHGGISYSSLGITYRDARGNEETLDRYDVLGRFDDLLDVCNGLILALSVFLLSRPPGYCALPRNLMVEELECETRSPYWHVNAALPSTQASGGSQLIVFCDVLTMDIDKVRFSALQTAILAEKFAPGFERYFLTFRSRNSVGGFAVFDGKNLERHRLSRADIEEYGDVTQEFLPMFLSQDRTPRIIHRAISLFYALQLSVPVIRADFRERTSSPVINVRNSQVHRNSWGLVLNSDVVIEHGSAAIDQALIRRISRKIIRRSLADARRKLPWFSALRYLPLGFASVHIYANDHRARRLAGFGLGADLIGTVRRQLIRRIKAPDIFGSTVENWRGLRLAWNREWLDRSTAKSE